MAKFSRRGVNKRVGPLIEEAWVRAAESRNPGLVARDFGDLLFSRKGQSLYEQALTFLRVRLTQIARYGGQFTITASDRRTYMKSNQVSEAIVSGIIPRVHTIDPTVSSDEIVKFVKVALDPDVDITPQDYLDLGMDAIVAMILAFGFGYPGDHEIWDEVDRSMNTMRKEIRRARKAKIEVVVPRDN